MDNSEEIYKAKLERLETTTAVKEPDRVPIAINTTYFPAKYAGISYHEMFYNNKKYIEAMAKFARDFNWDAYNSLRSFETVPLGLALAGYDPDLAIGAAVSSVLAGGMAHDILHDVYSSNPGREVGENVESQFVIDTPVMNANEYDDLIKQPFEYLMKTVIPRAYKNLANLDSPTGVGTLLKMGQEIAKFPAFFTEFIGRMKQEAWLPWYLALTPNPLDFIGAWLRDFDTLTLDLYRMPDKVKAACKTLAPVLAAVGKLTGKISQDTTGSRRVFCPTWYNTYLSPEQYREFHLPYIKIIVNELVEAGFTPLLCFQGRMDHLLDTLKEFPEKKVILWFDKTDLSKVKEVVGDKYCIAGGVLSSLLISGTPNLIKKHIKETIDKYKSNGGYIVTTEFNGMGDAKLENVKAMTEAVMEYGKY